jgi:hypothetical protein
LAGLCWAALAVGCLSTNELWEPEREFTHPPLVAETATSARSIGERRAADGSRELVVDCKDLDGALVLREPTEGALLAWDMIVGTDAFDPARVRIVVDHVVGRTNEARVVMEGALDTTRWPVPARASYDALLRRRDREELGVADEELRVVLLQGIENLAALWGEEEVHHAGVALLAESGSRNVLVWRWDGDHGSYYVVPMPVVLLASQFTRDAESGRPLPVLESTWQVTLSPSPASGDLAIRAAVEVVYREYRAGARYSVHGFVNRVARTPGAATKDLVRGAAQGLQYAGKAFKDLKGDVILYVYALIKGRAPMPSAPPEGH